MGRNREPIALIEAKGKSKHITKAEREKRLSEEVKVDLIDVSPPDYLPDTLKEEFDELAEKLLNVGIFTELDVDRLAMYVLSRHQYLYQTNLMRQAMKSKDIAEMHKISSMQDKAFNQCRACASDLGLSISSRCKLLVPLVEAATKPAENKFAKFLE